MPNVRIEDLAQELVTRCTALAAFKDRGFSIFSVDDLVEVSKFQGFPMVGIAFEGTTVKDSAVSHSGRPAYRCTPESAFVTMTFSITIGIEYRAVGADDTKPTATDLLDAIRSSVLGYFNVNTRPWVLVGESPLDGDIEGVIFYSQIWETDVIVNTSTS